MAEFARIDNARGFQAFRNPAEPELLERILLAFAYGTGASSSKAIFDFCFENVFDLLEPKSCSMWKYEQDQEWSLWVTRGEDMELPNGFKNWGDVNRASVLSRRTNSIGLGIDIDSEYTHLASPVILQGESCYVLHLVAKDSTEQSKTLESFIQTLAYLIVNFKFMDGHSNSGESHNGAIYLDGQLSKRQKEILELIRRDMTYQQIANRVGYSESTVKQEAMKIFKVLGVHNRNEVVRSLSK